MKSKISFIFSISILLLSACGSDKKLKEQQSNIQENAKLEAKGFTLGTIIDKTGLDGCSYLIKLPDSTLFEPINLKEDFKKDQITVAFKYKKSRKATVCMNGQPIVISEIMLNK